MTHLFLTFVKYGLLCFGGGYMLIPLLLSDFVGEGKVFTSEEFGNLVSIAQMTPGPVGINTATYVGYLQGAFLGALLATFGLVVPSLILGSAAVTGINRWKDTFAVRGIGFDSDDFICGDCFLGHVYLYRIYSVELSDKMGNLSASGSGSGLWIFLGRMPYLRCLFPADAENKSAYDSADSWIGCCRSCFCSDLKIRMIPDFFQEIFGYVVCLCCAFRFFCCGYGYSGENGG